MNVQFTIEPKLDDAILNAVKYDEDGWIHITERVAPGSGRWLINEDTAHGLRFVCPCGCGAIGAISVNHGYDWAWDGLRETPTLSPSIQRTSGCRWHGHLKKGVWEQC